MAATGWFCFGAWLSLPCVCPAEPWGKDLGLCWAPWAVGDGPQSSGGQGPSPEQPEGASASPQDHHEAPAVQTSSASFLLGISSQPLFVCAFGSATPESGNTWRPQGALRRECLLCSTCSQAQQKPGMEGRGGWELFFAVRQITAGTGNPQGWELCSICAAFASRPPWSRQGEHREVAAAVSLSDPQLSGQTLSANEPRATLSCSR